MSGASDGRMVYVAADPEQPGAAWAIADEDGSPAWKKELARSLADWIKRGAHVMRVDIATGHAMLSAWVRPTKPKQESLL